MKPMQPTGASCGGTPCGSRQVLCAKRASALRVCLLPVRAGLLSLPIAFKKRNSSERRIWLANAIRSLTNRRWSGAGPIIGESLSIYFTLDESQSFMTAHRTVPSTSRRVNGHVNAWRKFFHALKKNESNGESIQPVGGNHGHAQWKLSCFTSSFNGAVWLTLVNCKL